MLPSKLTELMHNGDGLKYAEFPIYQRININD